MRAEHILTFDQDEHEKSFLYDNKGDRTGLEAAITLINNQISKALKGTILDNIDKVDKILSDFYDKRVEAGEDIGTNVIKVVSEAIVLATASCYEKLMVFKGIH